MGCSQAWVGPGLDIGYLWEYHCRLEDPKYNPYFLVVVRDFVVDNVVLTDGAIITIDLRYIRIRNATRSVSKYLTNDQTITRVAVTTL